MVTLQTEVPSSYDHNCSKTDINYLLSPCDFLHTGTCTCIYVHWFCLATFSRVCRERTENFIDVYMYMARLHLKHLIFDLLFYVHCLILRLTTF